MAINIPWRRIAWITIISLPLAAVGAVVWGSTRDLSRYEARLADRVHKVTGRDIKTKVPISIRIGRDPALVAEGVTLSNAAWGSRPDLAQVRKITMYLDPFALLLGEVKVGRVVLEGADILVEYNEVGDANLEMLPPPDGSGPRPYDNRSLAIKPNPAFPWIGTIEVKDSVLTMVESPGRTPLVLNVASATFKSSASGQPMQMQARIGAPRAAMFDLSGGVGTFDGWMRGLPGNIDVQGSLGDGHIAIKGTIGAQKGTNLQITAEGSDFSVLGPYLRLPLPSGGPYNVTAKTLTLRNGFKVEIPSLKVGNSELAGEAMFRVSRSGTAYATVDIDASKIDLAGLHALPSDAPQADGQAQQARRFFPTQAFTARWLGRSQLTINARAAEITGLSSKVQNGSVALSSSEKRFTFRGAASIGGGSAGFDLVYDPAGRLGLTTLTGTASHVSFEDLSALLGLDLGLKEMVGDIDLRLRGPGRAAHDALNTASGTIEFSAGKGMWPREGLAGWPADTQRLLGGNDGAPVNCLAGSFEVKGGVANLRRLVVDTPRAVMIGGGYTAFRNENWEFILAPEARDAHGTSLASPLRIKGGMARETTGALEPGLAKLLIGAGPVPSLAGTLNQIARQPNVGNACALMAPKIDGMRPGLRAQLPTPVVEQRDRPNRKANPAANGSRSGR